MNNGSVNLFTSRRTNYLECEYWLVSKDERDKDKSDISLILLGFLNCEQEYWEGSKFSDEKVRSAIISFFLDESEYFTLDSVYLLLHKQIDITHNKAK